MAQVIWSPGSLRGLSRLQAFLRPKNSEAARRAAAAIRQGIGLLQQHPAVGRPVEDLDLDYRDLPIVFGNSGYLVRYQIRAGEVLIVAIKHAREAGY
jgi:plasmid stabilization system protein ParE